ncbi:GNAT family N-acetyltransferase [Oryzobacter terrae]|uniref:GNAT family N-acetyltransferase n=1 Tax=Oryzobacter terrae TaxID=1620385 RepID=UPI00366B82F3
MSASLPTLGAVRVVPADLHDPRVAVLLAEHLAEMEPTAPPESRHALTLDQFRVPGVRLWVAELDGELVGSVALKEVGSGHLELKTMRASASVRGLGLGRALLTHALAEARASGARRVSLETGVVPAFDAARALYASAGFSPCEPFGSYHPDRHSVFLTLEL